MFKSNTTKFIFILCLFSLLFLFFTIDLDGKTIKKRQKKHRSKIVNIQIKQEKILADSVLNPGLIYQNLLLGDGKRWFKVYLIKVDLKNSKNEIFVGKSKNNISGLANFMDFIAENSELTNIQAMINANFWSAYKNYPIGPLFINGTLITFKRHKQWSSLFLDKNSIPYIDNFDISGRVIVSPSLQFTIHSVNRRQDSSSMCFYNYFAGDTIPYVQPQNIAKALDSAFFSWIQERTFDMNGDDTEQEFDTIAFVEEYKALLMQNEIENQTTKLLCKYLDPPSINKPSKIKVIKITKSQIEVPKNHCVLSYGEFIESLYTPKVGDTLQILFETNTHKNIEFKNGISGTPRIARNGIYKNEAIAEGNNGKRFINHQLARTMVGYDKDKRWFYMIAIEGTNSQNGYYGASLRDLEKIARHFRLYDAINLDGGGSTAFIINGINKMQKSNPYSSRKLSAYLGVRYLN